ncbi:MAG: alpha/beta hydrolase, partial [Betaproteobacteria bacterium]
MTVVRKPTEPNVRNQKLKFERQSGGRLLTALLTVAISGCATNPATVEQAIQRRVVDDPVYTAPQRLVEIEPGRKLNIYCTGHGAPTVVFDSGQAGETSEWGMIQPAVARRTRACSYDRAGIGFSDPANRPSTSANIVDDLHRLLAAASISPPYILVGHSYGGMNIKLFAYRYPLEIAGIVFVDPSHEDQRENYRKKDPRQLSVLENEKLMLEPVLATMRECIAGVPKGFVVGTPLYKNCIGDSDPRFSAAINAAHVRMYEKADYHE